MHALGFWISSTKIWYQLVYYGGSRYIAVGVVLCKWRHYKCRALYSSWYSVFEYIYILFWNSIWTIAPVIGIGLFDRFLGTFFASLSVSRATELNTLRNRFGAAYASSWIIPLRPKTFVVWNAFIFYLYVRWSCTGELSLWWWEAHILNDWFR